MKCNNNNNNDHSNNSNNTVIMMNIPLSANPMYSCYVYFIISFYIVHLSHGRFSQKKQSADWVDDIITWEK